MEVLENSFLHDAPISALIDSCCIKISKINSMRASFLPKRRRLSIRTGRSTGRDWSYESWQIVGYHFNLIGISILYV